MQANKEINALLRLIDDPDDEVYSTVAATLVNYGRDIIPNLEQLWETTIDAALQQRIELLIHRVHFSGLQQEFAAWSREKHPELLKGAILVARLQFPDLNVPAVLAHFDKIRRNIWLELNSYLTPLEQVNVFNTILYSYYKLQPHELTERDPKYYFINQVLDSRQGNAYTIGVLYLALCEMLDIPIFAVDVPGQFIFAYIDTLHDFYSLDEDGTKQIQFYVDPVGGLVYTQADVDVYLRKLNVQKDEMYFVPLLTRRIIYKMLEELSRCYYYLHEDQKAEEVQQLMLLLGDEQ